MAKKKTLGVAVFWGFKVLVPLNKATSIECPECDALVGKPCRGRRITHGLMVHPKRKLYLSYKRRGIMCSCGALGPPCRSHKLECHYVGSPIVNCGFRGCSMQVTQLFTISNFSNPKFKCKQFYCCLGCANQLFNHLQRRQALPGLSLESPSAPARTPPSPST